MKLFSRSNLLGLEADNIVVNNLSSISYSDSLISSDKNSPTWMIEILPMQMERRESMGTGSRLKYHRLKKKMSVEEVSNGILPPKELKRIEGNAKEPSLKELEALCKKLEISLAPKDNPVGKVLVRNFKTSLLHPQNKGKIMELYSDIHDHPLLHVNEDIELEYNIQQIRYFIITGDLDNAEEKLKTMQDFKEFMTQEQFYLFHKYNGNYHYILNDFEVALKTYLIGEKILPNSIPPLEKGDLFYSIGLSASQCWDSAMAFKYTEMALQIYQQEFVPKRIVECHINLGVTHSRIGNFKTSLEHYKNAFAIGKKLEIDILRFTTEYNVGYSHFLNQDLETAILHVESALDFVPQEYTADILLSYGVMIMASLELERYEEAKKWALKGKMLIDSKNLELDSPTSNVFKIGYLQVYALYLLLEEEFDLFEKVVLQYLIPNLWSYKSFYELGYFYTLLGNVYYKKGLFEKSATFLNESQKAFKKFIKRS